MKPNTRRFLICLSLANLLFVEAWVHLHFGFLSRRLRGPVISLHAGVLLDVLVLAGFLYGIDSLLMRTKHAAIMRRAGLLVCLLLIGKTLSGAYGYNWVNPVEFALARGNAVAWIGLSVAGVALVAGLFFSIARPAPMRIASSLILAVSPLFAIDVWLAVRTMLKGNARFADIGPIKHESASRNGPRIVWIIFDSADYHYAFEEHPAWMHLPEFDRLRSESVDFTYALAPGPRTEISIPGLLTGKQFIDQTLISTNDFDMTRLDRTHEHFRGQRTVFKDAEEMGARTAMLGVHLPYGRLIGDQLSYCRWWQWPCDFGGDEPWLESAARLFAFVPSKPITYWNAADREIRNHKEELEEAKGLVSNQNYRLTFLHFFPPHPEPMYDGITHRYTLDHMFEKDGYFHGLTHADDTFGEIRKAMERSGTWNDTLVIVTADHSWRTAGGFGHKVWPRVPFLCHFPSQTSRVPATDKINTVLTHDLLLAYLKGTIKGPTDFVGWTKSWTVAHPQFPLTDTPPNTEGNDAD